MNCHSTAFQDGAPSGPVPSRMPADQSDAPAINQGLPEPLPSEPFRLFQAWLDEAWARRVQPNPNAMALATVDAVGCPSVRIVLCKGIDSTNGFVVFYTN